MAVACSLEDTKFSTLACDNLILTTGHKPLVKIFGDRLLDEITSTRIFHFKQRTLVWRFKIVYVPGKFIPVTWSRVKEATISDPYLKDLKVLIVTKFPASSSDLPAQLQPYWKYGNDMSIIDDVILIGSRILIPPSLREEICKILHSAHHGTSDMTEQAKATVFW